MGAKEKAARKDWDRRLMRAAGSVEPALARPVDEEIEKLLDEYDDAEESDDLLGMLKVQIKILELCDDGPADT